MVYSIHDVAKQFQISEHTIRFYDKEGLFPFLSRNKIGNREFTESDLEWLQLVFCLKNTGMKIKEIRQYMELCQAGEDTLQQRKNIFIHHRAFILEQMEQLKESLKLVDAKIAFYDDSNMGQRFER